MTYTFEPVTLEWADAQFDSVEEIKNGRPRNEYLQFVWIFGWTNVHDPEARHKVHGCIAGNAGGLMTAERVEICGKKSIWRKIFDIAWPLRQFVTAYLGKWSITSISMDVKSDPLYYLPSNLLSLTPFPPSQLSTPNCCSTEADQRQTLQRPTDDTYDLSLPLDRL